MRPVGLEVADIFRLIGPAYRAQHAAALSRGQRRVMSAVEQCRTMALGGHVEQCDACWHQCMVRAQWLEDRMRSGNTYGVTDGNAVNGSGAGGIRLGGWQFCLVVASYAAARSRGLCSAALAGAQTRP